MRKFLLYFIILLTGFIFLARLFYLQVLDESFSVMSENNAVRVVYDYPQRGYIYDRNGTLLVSNQPSYDVMAIPRNVKAFDTSEFSRMLNISEKQVATRLEKAKIYSLRLPSIIVPQLTKSEFAYFQEKMRNYEGFYIQKRSLRDYQTKNGSNVLGYIAEVNKKIIEENPYYISGDLIGKQGVEGYYEDLLRGVKGVKHIQKDRFNSDIGPFKEGIYDTLPQRGQDLTITIDGILQAYGERLMENKWGGIVALEPATGEILALITAPSYDPALLVGRLRSRNFTELYNNDFAKPLYDRGLQAEYPPGSPFKAINALIALQENVVTTEERFYCSGGYVYGKRNRMGCHPHESPLNMVPGIAQSCNAYFANVYRRIVDKYPTPQQGVDAWANHVKSFGLGDYLGSDLSTGRPGKIPTAEVYNKKYPNNKWYSTATISNAIGQGEVLMTPIQLANMTAAIANRGWFITPHILKSVDGIPIKDKSYTEKKYTTIEPRHFDPVVEGMHEVYKSGTAKTLRIPNIEIAGKTGTAENFTKIDGKRVQLKDHSIFIAFAPVDNPKIAIAVFIENGHYGATYAGRIAGLMIEKYFNGEITRTDMEEWILSNSLEEEYQKQLSEEPFSINR